ncbi:MAG: glycosyltransferase [bacterium]|nr:glycosyltransferase [bacterium]
MKIKEKEKVLLLCVENRSQILTEYAKWLVDIAWNREVEGIKFWKGQRRPIWYMRRVMIAEALQQTNFDYLLFVDTDVIPPKGFIDKFIATFKKEKVDGLCGTYFLTDGNPVNRKDNKAYKGKGIEEVDVLGMGFSMFNRKCLNEVMYPDPEPIIKPDGDLEFCRQLKEKGYILKQDFDIKAYHLLQAPFIF